MWGCEWQREECRAGRGGVAEIVNLGFRRWHGFGMVPLCFASWELGWVLGVYFAS